MVVLTMAQATRLYHGKWSTADPRLNHGSLTWFNHGSRTMVEPGFTMVVPCTAERIKMLIQVNTLGGPWNIVLDGGPDPPQRGGGHSMQPSPNYFGLLFLLLSPTAQTGGSKYRSSRTS